MSTNSSSTTTREPTPHRGVDSPLALDCPPGFALFHNPLYYKGTAFTDEERERLHLKGLLPPRVFSEAEQVQRAMGYFRRRETPLGRYLALTDLQDRNETLFYRVVIDNIEEMMPLVYTPTVGQACQQYGHIFRRPRGLFVTARHRGQISQVLANWPEREVEIIVVTDGERILGLGDLGAHGMGIPVGKLSLYTACAGIPPRSCLPVTLDVGTNNQALREDPLYIGLQQPRLTGAAYDEFIEEFILAATERYPGVLIQFEDFANHTAFRLLDRYRERICTFNDDIQGTAGVTLAGILASLRVLDQELSTHRLLFFGAGEANLGNAHLVVSALEREGLSEQEALRHCWFYDSRGLVVQGREGLNAHKAIFAHPHAPVQDLETAVRELRPTGLIGASGVTGAFTRGVVEALCEVNDQPLLFALSNPTSKAECTAEQAYQWSRGRALFASGSPFDPVVYQGRTLVSGQSNNAYIFPGVGLGIIASGARHVTDEMFLVAARVLADAVSDAELASGRLFPRLDRIREVSALLATAVAELAHERGLATKPRPVDLHTAIRDQMYEPVYQPYF